jgi:DNA-binding MarR family transcriptional regulator
VIDKKELWSLAEETMRAFGPFYWGAMRKAIDDTGAPNDWFGLSLARGSAPAPFTVERSHAMTPYAARERLAGRLEGLVQLELLERAGDGVYRLTDLGWKGVESIFEAAHQGLEGCEPLPADEMDRLNGLLCRLVDAALELPEPEAKWGITYSRWTDPGEVDSGTAKADQYLTDLGRFRDDAHLAAWQPYDVSGHAWEALTFVWRGDAGTAEELAERLQPFRGYAAEEYAGALRDLAARGWVVEDAGVYQLTGEGRRVREAAEDETDRLFFAGWSALSEEELGQLQDLLARANENLRLAGGLRTWNLAREVSQGINRATRDVVTPLMEKHGLDRPGFAFILITARRFAPELISAARLCVRGPYAGPAQYERLLAQVTEAGLMTPKEDGEYVFTEKGRAVLGEVEGAFYTRLGELSLLPDEDMAQLEGGLRQLVEACMDAEEPASKPCISLTHQGDVTQEYGVLAKIDQHLDDLNAFRDDAHLAAWQPYGVSGHGWDALTSVWRGDANTASALAEALPFRGHSAEDYAEAFADLAVRGWVEQAEEGYQITERGAALRQEAEDATDRYFFAPWAALTGRDRMLLYDQLMRLRDSLQDTAATRTAFSVSSR